MSVPNTQREYLENKFFRGSAFQLFYASIKSLLRLDLAIFIGQIKLSTVKTRSQVCSKVGISIFQNSNAASCVIFRNPKYRSSTRTQCLIFCGNPKTCIFISVYTKQHTSPAQFKSRLVTILALYLISQMCISNITIIVLIKIKVVHLTVP